VASTDPKQNGCPPPKDEDADGIPDEKDACPNLKGIPDPDPKKNGCPGDTDGDGIRDDKDACPEEKGKPDPDPKQNGCPKNVRVTTVEVLLLRQIQFDTAKATIKKVSDPILDEISDVLKDHPEITKVEVQGHTDSQGPRAVNVKLSQARAESVVKALVKRKIDASRLDPKGYGPDKPIADNKTPDGRQKNRRVQFIIMERKEKK
jgi:outer membrane protein OmpA-like peptidoglycan-associated protein